MNPAQCDPYICRRCLRVYLYLDLMGDPGCECSNGSWQPVRLSKQVERVLEATPEDAAPQINEDDVVPAPLLKRAHDQAEFLRHNLKRVGNEINAILDQDERRYDGTR